MIRSRSGIVAVGVAALAASFNVPSAARSQAPAGTRAQANPQAAPPKTEPQPDLINPDRPGLADGSNVVGRHHFQIEIGVQQEFRKESGISTRTTFIPTLLRFGL